MEVGDKVDNASAVTLVAMTWLDVVDKSISFSKKDAVEEVEVDGNRAMTGKELEAAGTRVDEEKGSCTTKLLCGASKVAIEFELSRLEREGSAVLCGGGLKSELRGI